MFTIVLAFTASATSAYGFWIFNQSVIAGHEKPNTASWNLWILLTVVQVSSYFTMNQDWRMSALLITDTVLCIATWAIAFWRGSFAWPPRRDYFPIALTFGAVVIWKFGSAANATLFTQVPLLISCIPYLTQAWKGEVKTKPWAIWTVAFGIYIMLIHYRHLETGRGDWHDYVPPVVGVVLHGLVALIAELKKPQVVEA